MFAGLVPQAPKDSLNAWYSKGLKVQGLELRLQGLGFTVSGTRMYRL